MDCAAEDVVNRDSSRAEPAAGFDILIPVFVVFPILLFIFSKVYKWNNWKDKLFGKVHFPQENQHEQLEADSQS